MKAFITALRAIATLLVMNSHLDNVWPVSAIATGGSLGDSLFFWISGFCLFNIRGSYIEWLAKRLLRIYPAVLIVSFVTLLISAIGGAELIGRVYPTSYSFINAIVVFYVIYYPLRKIDGEKMVGLWVALAASVVLYFVAYSRLDLSKWSIESQPFKYIYWFQMFIIGGIFAGRMDGLEKVKWNKIALTSFSGMLFVLFYGLKIVLLKLEMMQFQCTIHAVEIAFICVFVCLMISMEDRLKKQEGKKSWKAVNLIGSLTLENYLVMDLIIRKAEKLSFPVSFLIVVVGIFTTAYSLHFVTGKINKMLLNKKVKG